MIDFDKIKIKPVIGSAKRLTMTDAEYFGDKLPGYVSNSRLSLLNPDQGGSYDKYVSGFDDSNMNQNSLELGSAVHALFLEKELYKLSEFEKPSGKVGPIIYDAYKIMSSSTEELKLEDVLRECAIKNDYFKNSLTDNRIAALKTKGLEYYRYLLGESKSEDGKVEVILSADLQSKCSKMIRNLENDGGIQAKFFPEDPLSMTPVEYYNEDVVTFELEVDVDGVIVPIFLKGKIDNWSIDYDTKTITINDLKTTGKEIKYFAGYEYEDYFTQEKKFVSGSFQSFHYYRQVAMYSWMLWHYAAQEKGVVKGWNANANIAIVESVGEHNTSLMPITKSWISKGFEEFNMLIKMLAYYKLQESNGI